MPDDEEPWDLRGRDVARMLGCDESQVYRYARAGKLPHTLTAGGQRRYRRSDVDRVLDGMRPTLATSQRTLDERVTDLEAWRARVERDPDVS